MLLLEDTALQPKGSDGCLNVRTLSGIALSRTIRLQLKRETMRIVMQASVALCLSSLWSSHVSLTLPALHLPSSRPHVLVSPLDRVDYTLRVDSADLGGITVDMRIRGAPAEF